MKTMMTMVPCQPSDDDPALLHSPNSAEISQNMHTFYQAISHLEDMEDEISEIHKNLVEHEK